jgi:hypothetical protein
MVYARKHHCAVGVLKYFDKLDLKLFLEVLYHLICNAAEKVSLKFRKKPTP